MIPATSQLFLLISITTVNVSLGSNGVSERLRSLSGFGSFFGFGIDGLRRRGLTSAPMDAIDGLILFFRLTRSPRRSPHSICTLADVSSWNKNPSLIPRLVLRQTPIPFGENHG